MLRAIDSEGEEVDVEVELNAIEEKNILLKLPIDLSTITVPFDDIECFIAPNSSVYRQQFGQEDRNYV